MVHTVWQFIQNNWLTIAVAVGYFLLTCANQMPEKWVGWYPYLYNVIHSLAASPPAKFFESRYNVTDRTGASVTQTVTTSTPVTAKENQK